MVNEKSNGMKRVSSFNAGQTIRLKPEKNCGIKKASSFNDGQPNRWKPNKCMTSHLTGKYKYMNIKRTSFPKDLQQLPIISTKSKVNSSDSRVTKLSKENTVHDNKPVCRPFSFPSYQGQELLVTAPTSLHSDSTPDILTTQQTDDFSTDSRMMDHGTTARIILTDVVYEQFRDNLVKNKIPKYLHMTYLDTDSNTIFVGVKERYLEEAQEIIASISPKLYNDGRFDIQPLGDIDYCGGKTKDFTAKPMVTAENSTYQSTPGQILPKIQTGKSIETRACSENAAEAVSVRLATFGSIIKDVNSGKLYGITAKHAFNTKDGFEIGDGDTYCDINENINGELPTFSKCQVSKKYIGIHGGFLNEKTNYRCALDIAVVPLLDHLKIGAEIFPYFENKSGSVDITIYRAASEDLKGKKVQQLGGKSSLVHGKIIVPKFDVYIQGKWFGNDAFLVASEDTVFASQGDSGALILDDLSSSCTDANAYGILFYVENKCFRKSPNTGKPYPAIAWCTRLDYGLDYIQQEHNIVLDFVKPDRKVIGLYSSNTKYGTYPLKHGICCNKNKSSATLGAMSVSTSDLSVDEQSNNTIESKMSKSDQSYLHNNAKSTSPLQMKSSSEVMLDTSKQNKKYPIKDKIRNLFKKFKPSKKKGTG